MAEKNGKHINATDFVEYSSALTNQGRAHVKFILSTSAQDT